MSDKPISYQEAGVSTYRASAIGRCARALVASRLGFEPLTPSDQMQTVFDEGHLHEGSIVQRLRDQGYDIQDRDEDGGQITITIPVGRKIVIVGHVDGMIDDRVLECKAMSQDNFKKAQNNHNDLLDMFSYGEQLTVYMAATGRKAFYAVKNRNTGELLTFLIDQPPRDINKIKARILKIEKFAQSGELPPCDVADRWNCPFRYLHDDQPDDVTLDEAIEALAATYDDARLREKEAAAAKDEAKKRITEHLGEKDKVESPNYKVTRFPQQRKKIDSEKMKAELGDDAVERYTVITQSEVVKVTRKGERKTKDAGAKGPVVIEAEKADEGSKEMSPVRD